MQIVKGFYDDGNIVLVEKISEYKGEIVVIFPIGNKDDANGCERAAFLGCMKGRGWVSDDFNDPIDDMEDYM